MKKIKEWTPFIILAILVITIVKVIGLFMGETPPCPGDDRYCVWIEEDEKYWREVGR